MIKVVSYGRKLFLTPVFGLKNILAIICFILRGVQVHSGKVHIVLKTVAANIFQTIFLQSDFF
jgi:hypothetical protein